MQFLKIFLNHGWVNLQMRTLRQRRLAAQIKAFVTGKIGVPKDVHGNCDCYLVNGTLQKFLN